MRRPHTWDNTFFYISDNSGHPDVKIVMHSFGAHDPPGGMGSSARSRTLTPAHYGESRDDPVRSYILLRSWMVWRAGLHGWSGAHPGRAREFAEESALLERDVRQLQPQPGGLLGHPAADSKLRMWVPEIVAKIL